MTQLRMSRVILFTRRIDRLAQFCRDVLGPVIRSGTAAEGWVEFDSLALHRGKSKPGTSKISFGSRDVKRTREELVRRGANLGKVQDSGDLVLCDGKDPDGNLIQISSRL
jgi:hypothetical protein